MLTSLRPYAPTAILGILVFYAGFHILTGERGLMSTQRRQETRILRERELADLKRESHELEVRAYLLDPRHLSADLLEERARSLLGYVGPNDYVVRMPVAAG